MKRIKRLEPLWLSYRKTVIPKAASNGQVNSFRNAFYGGAISLFLAMGDVVYKEDGAIEEPTEESMHAFAELQQELKDFAVEKGFRAYSGSRSVQ